MNEPLSPIAQVMDLKANILLVEDRQSEVILTRISLDNANLPYGLTILKNGSEVLPYLTDAAKAKPDLLLLDMMLPDMDGLEILAKITMHPELLDLPIIILSGRGDMEDIKNRFALNIVAYLPKPLDPLEMRRLLVQLQGARR